MYKEEIKTENGKEKIKFAKQAIILTCILTSVVALYELAVAYSRYQFGMSIFDLAALATCDRLTYCIIFIFATLITFPFALILYKEKGISLKNEIYERKTLLRDIGLGIAALIVSEVAYYIYDWILPRSSVERTSVLNSTWVVSTISLVFLSGILKEVYYRGFAKTFVAPVLGETLAFFLFNILFGLLDWPNLGHSFIAAIIWTFFYKKSGHLITPIIAHSGANLIGAVYYIIWSMCII